MIDKKLRRLNNLLSKVEERKMEKVIEAANEVTDFTLTSREAKRFQKRVEDVLKDIRRVEEDMNELRDEFPDADVTEIEHKIEQSKSAIHPYQEKYDDMLSDKHGSKESLMESSTIVGELDNDRTKEKEEHRKLEVLDKEIKKALKDVEQDFFMFDKFEMKTVRNITNIHNAVDHYHQKIERAIEKLEVAENSFAGFTSKYPNVDVSVLGQKIQDGRSEIEEHRRVSERYIADRAYYEAMSQDFEKLTDYFGEWPGGYYGSYSLDREFTYSDTKRLLALAEDIDLLKGRKENYEKSLERLNDDKFIESYYDYIDEKISLEKDGGQIANGFYDWLSVLHDCMFPENENLKGVLQYLNKLKGKFGMERQEATSDVVVSDFHANHVNQVFFTDNETKAIQELSETDMKTQFQPGETIRCIAFLDNTYRNIYGKYSRAHFSLNDVWRCDTEEFTEDDLDKGYIEFKLVTDAKNYVLPETASYSSVEKAMTMLLDLPPRLKSIEVTVKSDGGDTGTAPKSSLVGKFKIDGTDDAGIELLRKNLKIVKAKSLTNERVSEPSMQDHDLEQEILTFFNGLKWEESFKKAIITSNGYYAIKNGEQVSVARGLDVTMLSESDNGCFQQAFTIAQDQIGEDWTGFRIHSRGSKSEISCQKISL